MGGLAELQEEAVNADWPHRSIILEDNVGG